MSIKSRNVILIFGQQAIHKPILYNLAVDYQIVFNILEARIFPRQEGRMILQLQGDLKNIDKAIKYMQGEKVEVEFLADKIKRDDDKCIHCGACTSVCRTEALCIDRKTMEVLFFPEKCIACDLCKIACPVGAVIGTSIDMDL